jgi:GWxTD domain-containing protein
LLQLNSIFTRVSSRCAALLLVLTFFTAFAVAADRSKNLPPRYRHWINEEVNYIIGSDERKQFLDLKTDGERDHFIDSFWRSLNPSPNSSTNSFKEEHYRRLAYANEHFGNLAAQDGWRTDQGRIYITLGAPKQIVSYPAARNVRPIEIWFYQTHTPALPPYFNLLFYKRSITEPYAIYSPYQDGPARLVSTLEALNDQKRSIDTLRKSLGDEVAKTALSLIPSEAVNFDNYTPSLSSDLMIGTIEGLPDNPITKSLRAERRSGELVTSTIYFGDDSTQLETAIFRDGPDRMTASYLVHFSEPNSSLIGKLPNGHDGYSVTVQATVLTPNEKAVYRDIEQHTGELAGEDQINNARTRIFGAEGRLPLAPGKYQLLINITNNLDHVGARKLVNLTVPDPKHLGFGMSKLLAFAPLPPVQTKDAQLPFSIAGVRFVPRGTDNLSLHHGDPLRIAYQLWSNPAGPSVSSPGATPHKISVHYAYGSFGDAGHAQQESEEINAANFDASGNLLTGRTFQTLDMPPGNYRMVVTAVDETTQQKAYSTINFRIVDDTDTASVEFWTAYNAAGVSKEAMAIDDYKRGVSAIASGDSGGAAHWLQQSLTENPEFSRATTKLVDVYTTGVAASDSDKQLAELSHQIGLTHELDQTTAIRLAQADAKTGDLPGAKRILEYELGFQAPNAKLFQAISEVYQQMGDSANAESFRKRAAAL